MNTLIERHYKAVKKRGFITESTTLEAFMSKIEEEYLELWNAYADAVQNDDKCPDNDMIHEAIDLMAVITNMLHFYGVNVSREFQKNINYQRSRI